MKNIVQFTNILLLAIAAFFASCEAEDTLGSDPGGTVGSGAKIKLKVSMTPGAHKCITETYGESTLLIVGTDPSGGERFRKFETIKAYSATDNANEVEVVYDGLSAVGTWTFRIYDEAGTFEYDTPKTQVISSSDVEKERTESVIWFVNKSEAGC